MLSDNKSTVSNYFDQQSTKLQSFYNRMQSETDHLKNVMAVKLYVQLHQTGSGFNEALKMLVSGELIAREVFQKLFNKKDNELWHILSLNGELNNAIESINNDNFNIFPIRILLKLAINQIENMRIILIDEKKRRLTFPNYNEITGKEISEQLSELDIKESIALDDYFAAFDLFIKEAKKILHEIALVDDDYHINIKDIANNNHLLLENMTDTYHRKILILLRSLQTHLKFLEERHTPTMSNIIKLNKELLYSWDYIKTTLLPKRMKLIGTPAEGRLFKGINPELAKLLSGLLSMKDGIKIDQETGKYIAKHNYDPDDPFGPITDPANEYAINNIDNIDSDAEEIAAKERLERRKKNMIAKEATLDDDDNINNKFDGKKILYDIENKRQKAKNRLEDKRINIINNKTLSENERKNYLNDLKQEEDDIDIYYDKQIDLILNTDTNNTADVQLLQDKLLHLTQKLSQLKDNHEKELDALEQELELQAQELDNVFTNVKSPDIAHNDQNAMLLAEYEIAEEEIDQLIDMDIDDRTERLKQLKHRNKLKKKT